MDEYGERIDGTPKGRGWFGPQPYREAYRYDDDPFEDEHPSVATELSFDYGTDDKMRPSILAPLLAPTLDPQELHHMLNGGEPTDAIWDKATRHSDWRVAQGKSPFAEPGEGGKNKTSMLAGLMHRRGGLHTSTPSTAPFHGGGPDVEFEHRPAPSFYGAGAELGIGGVQHKAYPGNLGLLGPTSANALRIPRRDGGKFRDEMQLPPGRPFKGRRIPMPKTT